MGLSGRGPASGFLASAMRLNRLLHNPPPPPPDQRSYARDSSASGRTVGEALEIEDSDDDVGAQGGGARSQAAAARQTTTAAPKSSVVRVGGREVVEIQESDDEGEKTK